MESYGGKFVDAVDMGATFTSKPLDCQGLHKRSLHAVWTGANAPSGAHVIEGSNDPRVREDILRNTSTATWTVLTISTVHGTAAPAGSASSSIIIVENLPRWIRYKYSRSSGGSGDTMTVHTEGSSS